MNLPNPVEGFPFFDAATGSLGQGLSVAAGLAAAARLDKLDKRIFCIIGDGEAREGQIWSGVIPEEEFKPLKEALGALSPAGFLAPLWMLTALVPSTGIRLTLVLAR